MFRAELILNNQQSEQELYVVKDPLLGQPAIEALGLLSRVRSVHTTQPEVLFPKLFQGLGKLSGEYRIQLKEEFSSKKEFRFVHAKKGPYSLLLRKN